MSLRQVPAYQQRNAEAIRGVADDSDAEEEALAQDYREQVQYDQDGLDDLDRSTSLGGGSGQDIHAQLAAAATPLDFQATLETKFASYDNYCSLFHYILNSEGPVDLEVPSVSLAEQKNGTTRTLTIIIVLLGVGCHRRVHLSVQHFLHNPTARSNKRRE